METNNANVGKSFFKKNSKLVIILVVVVLLVLWCGSKYNGLVRLDEDCNSQWSKVETQYQRRMDLIPNLVEIVKGYAAHEQETFTKVIEARNKALNTSTTENSTVDYQKAQSNLTSAIRDLNVVVERYPELKANENFKELQSQLEGTENRISVERTRYAESVQNYNKKRRSFPTNIAASLFGFDKKDYYAAEEGAQNAPKIKF